MEKIFRLGRNYLRYAASIVFFLIVCGAEAEEGWSLKMHSKDRNLTNKPALIGYTNPSGKDSSYSIDAALIYTFATQFHDLDGKVVVEAHKNTQTKKESDSVLLGVAGEYPIAFNCDAGICDFVYIDAALDAKKDQVKQSESAQVVIELKFYSPDWYIDSYKETTFGDFYWVPQFAIEIEDFVEADNDQEGHWTRIMSQVEIGFETSFLETFERKIKFYMVHTNWQDRSKSDRLQIAKDSHNLRVLGIAYPLANRDQLKVSISLTNVDGENLRTNTRNQEYSQISFGVTF